MSLSRFCHAIVRRDERGLKEPHSSIMWRSNIEQEGDFKQRSSVQVRWPTVTAMATREPRVRSGSFIHSVCLIYKMTHQPQMNGSTAGGFKGIWTSLKYPWCHSKRKSWVARQQTVRRGGPVKLQGSGPSEAEAPLVMSRWSRPTEGGPAHTWTLPQTT